jgi:hypothetical protein
MLATEYLSKLLMATKVLAFSAIVASAAAYAPSMVSMYSLRISAFENLEK